MAAVNTYYVYMLRCADASFYVGITNDLELRIAQHQSAEDRRCYTFSRLPVVLVHSSEFRNVDDAIAWEKHLKGWSRGKKLALIENDWSRIRQLARNHWGRLCNSPAESASSAGLPETERPSTRSG